MFVAALLALMTVSLRIGRYYNEHYGRISISIGQRAPAAVAAVATTALMLAASLLLRSDLDWSLDLPVTGVAAALALGCLSYYALTVGVKPHHAIIWGPLLVAALLPVWGGLDLPTPATWVLCWPDWRPSHPGSSTTASWSATSNRRTTSSSERAMPVPKHEPALDRLIHEPARLAIVTVLSSVQDADFTFLQRTTGLTKGNLSSHLTKLETAGLVQIDKTFVRKKPNTKVALTPLGRQRVAHHWDQLERLKRLSQNPASTTPGPIHSPLVRGEQL